VLKLYRATADPASTAAELGAAATELHRPALVVWGAKDPYIGVEYAECQREFFDVQGLEILPDSGHWPFQMIPTAWREPCSRFCAGSWPVRAPVLGKQVLRQRPQEGGRTRAVFRGDEALEALDDDDGSRESLARARSAAAAAASATASQVALSSRPLLSVRPRQSSSGCMPARPSATSS